MVLVYAGRDKKELPAIETILSGLDIPFKKIGDQDLDRTIQELTADDKETDQTDGKDPFFIFYDDLDSKDIGKAESALQTAGIDTARKALRTENNQTWKLKDLMYEVGKEARWFALSNELYQLVTHPDRERLKTDDAYMKLMAGSFALLEENDADEEVLENAIRAIKAAS